MQKNLKYWFIIFIVICILQDRELQDIIDNSWHIERVYGYRFNSTLVNEEINKSFKELLNIVKKVETESQWVPATWVLTS